MGSGLHRGLKHSDDKRKKINKSGKTLPHGDVQKLHRHPKLVDLAGQVPGEDKRPTMEGPLPQDSLPRSLALNHSGIE